MEYTFKQELQPLSQFSLICPLRLCLFANYFITEENRVFPKPLFPVGTCKKYEATLRRHNVLHVAYMLELESSLVISWLLRKYGYFLGNIVTYHPKNS